MNGTCGKYEDDEYSMGTRLLFDTLKSNFSQPDQMIKDFYFNSVIKFSRPDFIPLYLAYYPKASNQNKEIIIGILNESDFKDLIKYTKEYVDASGIDGITNLIDQTLIARQKESILDTLNFVISLKDSKYKSSIYNIHILSKLTNHSRSI